MRASRSLVETGLALERLNVRGGRAFGTLLRVVAHLRTLGQRLEAVAEDRGVMHKQVLARVIRRDESETLLVAEPLHSSCGHLLPSGNRCALRTAEGAQRQQLRKREALLRPCGCP